MASSSIVSAPYVATFQDWSPNTTIPRLRPILYLNTLYRCDVTHVSGASFDPSKFTALAGMSEAPIDGNQYVRKNASWDTLTIDTSQVAIDLTANTNGITAGNVVELVSTGGQNVQNIYHCEAPTISSLATLAGTNDVYYLSLSTLGDGSNALAVWYDGTVGFGQVGKITAGSPPTLSGVIATSTNLDRYLTSCSLGINTAAVTFLRSGVFHTAVASVSGTNITLSSTATNAAATLTPATCALTTSNWFVAYADTNSDSQIRTAVSNGTNAPTLGTALNVNSENNVNYISLARTTDTSAILILQDATSSLGMIANIDGGTTNAPTKSTLAYLDGTNNCTYITQSPIDSNHTLCAYRKEVTAPLTCLAVIQANGTNAPTVISRAEFGLNLPSVYLSLTAHSSNLHTLVYTGYLAYGNVITVNVDSNYNLTLSQTGYTAGTNQSFYNAVAALTPTTAIAAFQGTGSDGFAGTLTLTPTPVISGQLVGIAQTSATNGATASVAVGPLVSGTFTSGADYYASGAGGLTTNATPVHVLKAKSTTEGVLDLRGAPEAGKQNVWEITTPGAFTWTAPEDGEYGIVLVGAGGSGAKGSTAFHANGGNSGNVVLLHKNLTGGQTISGSLGTGAAAQTSDATNGTTGGSSSISSPFTATATGGRGGLYISAYNGNGAAPNPPNNQDVGSLGCGCGGTAKNFSFNGVPTYIGGIANLTASEGIAGVRGSGGTGCGTGNSGAGGDGVVRITLVHGSGK